MEPNRQTGSYWPLFAFVAVASLVLFALSCPGKPDVEQTTAPAVKPPPKPTFKPDEAWLKEDVGPIRIGTTSDEAVTALGEPGKKSEPTMQEATGEYVTRWTWDGIHAEFSSEATSGPWRAASVSLDSPKYQTQRGVRVGSTKAEVKAAYPEATAEGEMQIYGDVYGGIAFFTKNGKVESVFVGAQAE